VSEVEHRSNISPWQQLCEEKNAVLKVIPMTDNGKLRLNEYKNYSLKKKKADCYYSRVKGVWYHKPRERNDCYSSLEEHSCTCMVPNQPLI
jgi:hypothetical protein